MNGYLIIIGWKTPMLGFPCLCVCNVIQSNGHTHLRVEQLVNIAKQENFPNDTMAKAWQKQWCTFQIQIYTKNVLYLDQRGLLFLTGCSQTFLSSPSGSQWL